MIHNGDLESAVISQTQCATPEEIQSRQAEYIINVKAWPSVLTTPMTFQLSGSTTGFTRPSSSTVDKIYKLMSISP
jgi:hypothetical protein